MEAMGSAQSGYLWCGVELEVDEGEELTAGKN